MSDERKKKLKRFLKLSGIIIIVLALIPYLLDRFFAYELYAIWEGHMKRESPMKVSEWFGFLGSYLGAVGTIIIGIVAHMQQKFITEQHQHLSILQEQVGELQHDINVLQLRPIIRIKDTAIQVRDNKHERRKITKEIENQYYSIYGEQWGGDGIRYIMICISFEDRGIIPAGQCELSNIKWIIADKTYKIAFGERKQKINIWNANVVKILIEESDLADKETFFEAVDLHEHYVNNGTWGYEKSILALNMKYINHINQKEYNQLYELSCQIISGDEGLKAESNFLKFVEGGNV